VLALAQWPLLGVVASMAPAHASDVRVTDAGLAVFVQASAPLALVSSLRPGEKKLHPPGWPA
jgi:hypothetical protein